VVGIDRCFSWDNYTGGGHWLDNGARAVGDGQGCGLGDSVGGTAQGDGGSRWAVSSIGSVHLGGVGHGAVTRPGGDGGCGEREDGGDGVLHFGGVDWYYLLFKSN